MECPICRDRTRAVVVRTEHVYPDLFPGVPTFWAFMTPGIARSVTAAIGGVAATFLLVGAVALALRSALVGLSALPGAFVAAFVFARCRRALGQHREKYLCRCCECGLEWAQTGAPRER
jgi:hypothetical protein